jgi:hypothetical protein
MASWISLEIYSAGKKTLSQQIPRFENDCSVQKLRGESETGMLEREYAGVLVTG